MLKFDTCIGSGKTPIYLNNFFVSFFCPSLRLSIEDILIWNTLLQTLTYQGT